MGLADRDLTAEWGEIVRTNCTIGRRELSEQRDHLPDDPRGDGWGPVRLFEEGAYRQESSFFEGIVESLRPND